MSYKNKISSSLNKPSNIKAQRKCFLTHTLRGQTWCLIPVTILFDSEQFTVLKISCNTKWLAACDNLGKRVRLGEEKNWTLKRCNWDNNDLIYMIPTGEWYAFGLLADPTSRVAKQSYINFQKPFEIKPWGYDTLDLELDLIADFQYDKELKWTWKDVESFNELCRRNFFTSEEAEQVKKASNTAKTQYMKIKEEITSWAKKEVSIPSLDALLESIEIPIDIIY